MTAGDSGTLIPVTRTLLSVEEFRARLRARAFGELVDEYMISGPTAHVKEAEIELIASRLREKFAVPLAEGHFSIVGSAKLGFSLNERRLDDGTILQRYRPFSPISDIDVVVICPTIFDKIWNDLSAHAGRSVTSLPWKSGALGNYLVHGWLRPDLFPIGANLRRCDDWWDVFRSLSVDPRFERRKVRGGLFYSIEHLRRYQNRSVADCARVEALSI